MYPVAEGHNMYPDGADSLHSAFIFTALKMSIGFSDSPPADMTIKSVVFIAFSPLTVWNEHSPRTPTTLLKVPFSNPILALLEEFLYLYWVHSYGSCN